jgi:uncharacterized membrane protein HdeD (DUF308 family)
MNSLEDRVRSAAQGLAAEIKSSYGWYVALGVVLIVAGIAAIAYPAYAGLALTTLVGVLFLVVGGMYLFNAFMARSAGGFVFRLLLAVLSVGAGALLLMKPFEGMTGLTVVLGIVLFLAGILKILLSRALTGIPGVGMILFSGIASMVLAILIWAKLPASSELAIGVLVGIDFIISGVSLVSVAMRAKTFAAALESA